MRVHADKWYDYTFPLKSNSTLLIRVHKDRDSVILEKMDDLFVWWGFHHKTIRLGAFGRDLHIDEKYLHAST